MLDSLVLCNVYKLSFYVSLVDEAHYAINSIGAHFSDTAIYRNDFKCFSDYDPQVNNPKTKMLSDKENWIKIEGRFVADGGEQYITLGNFHLDSEIDTFPTDNNFFYGYSYYYLDNVSLIQIADETVTAYAGADTTIYLGDSVFIGQDIYNLNCTWTVLETGEMIADSTSGLYVSPTDTITYVVEQYLCGVKTYDTVTINVKINNTGLSDFDSAQSSQFTVIPNPNNGSFALQKNNLEIQELTLYDAQGRKLYNFDKNTNNFELNLSKGVYFIEIISENNRMLEKIVVN